MPSWHDDRGTLISLRGVGRGRRERASIPRVGDACQAGFTLAALIVVLALVSIFLAIAVSSVSFQMRREKEQELIFRGEQYVESIRLFRARNGRFPIALKELWEAKPRVLRKQWVDPITGSKDWSPVFLGQEGQEVPVGSTGGGLSPTPTPTPGRTGRRGVTPGGGQAGGPEGGPIIGVRSSSCEESIKLYEGRDRYCDWKFFFDPNKQRRPGAGPGIGPGTQPPRATPTRSSR